MTEITKLEDCQPDAANANEGTVRGTQLLGRSLEHYGAGRSILVDKHGLTIAGNKTLEAAVERGLAVKVVQSDGRKLVVVQRTDLDLAEPGTRELAYLDNRAAEVGLKWNPAQMEQDLAHGVELGGLFTARERAELLDALIEDTDVGEFNLTSLETKLSFKDTAGHEQWLALLRTLDERYPELDTVAAKLTRWLMEQVTLMDQWEAEAPDAD